MVKPGIAPALFQFHHAFRLFPEAFTVAGAFRFVS
jgi:hypothetical protein